VITAVVLAAGAGSRLGGPKALAELAGRSLLAHVLATCAASLVDEVVVVTGEQAERVAAAAETEALALPELPVRVVRHEGWRSGRTGSLQAGLALSALDHDVLVFPVDHPAVDATTLDLLLGVFGYAARHPDVVVPVHGDDLTGTRRRGHPVLLHARLRPAVAALRPDEPLHDLVHRSEVLEVPVDDPGILVDVNEPADLTRAALVLAAREG
jgi:CTP:molybdopterin cytidylyltransferase MocA